MQTKLLININELVNRNIVESERIEFKRSWNPLRILQTICGFANDFNNLGGGYVIIGIEEKKGKPQLPPIGITRELADKIQKELLNLCHKIQPNYFPLVFPIVFQKKLILVIWAVAGDNRPYKAPEAIRVNASLSYYIRRYSNTVKIRSGSVDERRLLELTARIPYDDRVNVNANIDDFDINIISEYLRNINSGLFQQIGKISHPELLRQMQIIRGGTEYIKPLNVGLLMFGKNPLSYFKGCRIDIVEFKDETGDEYTEKRIEGVLHVQIKETLDYFRNKILEEKIRKVPNRAESIRVYNYPYEAFEEILVNAVYHRSYENENPIEVRVHKNRIDILSFPGAMPPISNDDFRKQHIVARDYRNRRIGDFLKELHLTEGRATGIPKIKATLKNNGSPPPVFKMDRDRSYFLVTLSIHNEFFYTEKANKKSKRLEISVNGLRILKFCLKPRKRKDILKHLKLSNHSKHFKTYLRPLITNKLLDLTIPNNPKSPKQSYLTSPLGKKYF